MLIVQNTDIFIMHVQLYFSYNTRLVIYFIRCMSNTVHVFVSRGVIQHPVAYSLLLVLTKTNALISFQIAAEVHLPVFGPVDLVVAVINPLD